MKLPLVEVLHFSFRKVFDLIKINFDYVDHSYKLFIIKYVQMYIALLG